MLKNALVISLVVIQWSVVSECISLSAALSANSNAGDNSDSPLLTKLREEISKRQNRTDSQYEHDLKRAIRSNPKYKLKPVNDGSSSSSSQDSSSSVSSSSSEECKKVDVKKVTDGLKKLAHIVHCESCSSTSSDDSSSSCSCSCELCKPQCASKPKAIFVPVYDVEKPKVFAAQNNNYNTMRNTEPPHTYQNMYYHQPSYQHQRIQLEEKPMGYINRHY